jgi:hypothetical protein|tara:strand:+ start:615 stop:863 length:249 start_codon:yes stop_codon:yes gene_type:complete
LAEILYLIEKLIKRWSKKINSKVINIITTILFLFTILFIVSCEDDAILDPQTSDDCQGSYCNLKFKKGNEFAYNDFQNPKIY